MVQNYTEPNMNRTQARQRFKELTGLKPTRKNAHKAIWSRKGYVADWLQFALEHTENNVNIFDGRTAAYWTSLTKYIETLQEGK